MSSLMIQRSIMLPPLWITQLLRRSRSSFSQIGITCRQVSSKKGHTVACSIWCWCNASGIFLCKTFRTWRISLGMRTRSLKPKFLRNRQSWSHFSSCPSFAEGRKSSDPRICYHHRKFGTRGSQPECFFLWLSELSNKGCCSLSSRTAVTAERFGGRFRPKLWPFHWLFFLVDIGADVSVLPASLFRLIVEVCNLQLTRCTDTKYNLASLKHFTTHRTVESFWFALT